MGHIHYMGAPLTDRQHYKHTVPKIRNKYSQNWNWAASFPISTVQSCICERLIGSRLQWVANLFSMQVTLKGQCHEIFDFWFFSRISFPQAPEYTIRVVSNFFENSRRYLQLKVWHRCQRHRWQMQKNFNQKSFNYLVWTPVGSIVNL